MASFFSYCGSMETGKCLALIGTPPRSDQVSASGADQRDSSIDSVFTDGFEQELKEQSPDGCLLCLFDELGDEESD
jgi:hypothetical protein